MLMLAHPHAAHAVRAETRHLAAGRLTHGLPVKLVGHHFPAYCPPWEELLALADVES